MTTKEKWAAVGDAMSALGLKLKLHTEQEKAEKSEDRTAALERLADAVDGVLQGLGNAGHDPAVREDARNVARMFAEAVDATIDEARAKIQKHD